MTPRTKSLVGRVALIALVALSLGYPLLSSLSFVPACPFGNDVEFPGQTVCARTVGGLWRSIGVGLVAGGLSATIALLLALAARNFGVIADEGLTKAADLVFSLPDILVLIAIRFAAILAIEAWGHSLPSFLVGDSTTPQLPALALTVVALTAIGWAGPMRMFRNRLRTLESQEFVLAAHALGATRWRILSGHLLPFMREYVLAIFLLRVPAAILTESTVSFLNFGLPPGQASLGTYLGRNYRLILQGDWGIVVPAWALLVLVVIAFHWTGQGLLARQPAGAR